jgi:hypothetical protein
MTGDNHIFRKKEREIFFVRGRAAPIALKGFAKLIFPRSGSATKCGEKSAVIASEAKQSSANKGVLDCFVALLLAMTVFMSHA